jgi:hypothetical protein
MLWPVWAVAVEEFFGPVDEAEEEAATELAAGEEPAGEEAGAEEDQGAVVPHFRSRDAWLDVGTFGLGGEPPDDLPLHFQNWVLLEDVPLGPWLGDWKDIAADARYYYRSQYEEPFDRDLMEYSYKVKREEEEFYAWEQERGLIPDIELGRESDIKFEGRKLFSAGYSKTTYPGGNPALGGVQPAGDFTMEGELQLRIEGTVLRKTHVYVDYDDTRENETRNQVSVVYKGDPDELVQEAAFGDIILSLPATEFVSYSSSRAVFGAKVDLKYKWAHLMAIASREKGQTEKATFTGGTELTSITLSDTSYTRRKFFLLNTYYDEINDKTYFEGNRKLFVDPVNNLPKIEVFVHTPVPTFPLGKTRMRLDAYEFDDHKGDNETPIGDKYLSKKVGTDACVMLARGTEYDVDVDTGVLSLKTPLAENQRLAVAYVTADEAGNAKSVIGYYRDPGGTYKLDYVDKPNDVREFRKPLKCLSLGRDGGPLQRYEQKNYYYLGSTNVESTTLVVKVLDRNKNENDPDNEGKTYLYTLGLDRNDNGRVDPEFFDKTKSYIIVPDVEYNRANDSFTRRDVGGWRKDGPPFDIPDGFLDNLPFDYDMNGVAEDYDAYKPEIDSRRTFYFEYKSLKPSYFLHPNVIPGSEVVKLNGRVLVPNQEYWLDYDSGFLEILTEDANDPTAILEVTYEYKPLFTLLAKSLVGGRFQFGPDDDRYLGTTLIAEFTSKPPGDQIPKLEEAPVDHYVLDVDGRYRFYPEFMTKIADAVPGAHTVEGSTFDVSAEYARSYKNVNTVGEALVDDMEGARQLSTLSMKEEVWKATSAPAAAGFDQSNRGDHLLRLGYEPQHFLNEVDPDWPNDTLELLTLNALPNDPEGKTEHPYRWAGIHNILSPTGLDFTENRYEYVEIMINLNGLTRGTKEDDIRGGILHLDVGTISEDADGNQLLGTEVLDANGQLTEANDKGYYFDNTAGQEKGKGNAPDPPGQFYELIKHDKRLDTEDNNANLVLDTEDAYYAYAVDLTEVLNNSSPYVVRGPTSKDPLNEGWYILRVPLEFDVAETEGDPDPTRIRVFRVWLEAESDNDFPQGSALTLGTVTFAAMRWEDPVLKPDRGLNQMKVTTKDSRHDGDYITLRPVEDPETRTTEREQALVLQYILTDWDDVGVEGDPIGENEAGGQFGPVWGAGNNHYDTEDTNHNGVLDPGEDIGVGPYHYGAGNGRLDEEPAPEGSTRYTTFSAQDFSRYRRLQFWYFNRTPHDNSNVDSYNDIVFLRFGADEDNYFEYAVQMSGEQRWISVDVDLERLLGIHAKGQPFVERDEAIEAGHYRIVGDPSLLNIVEVRLGTRTKVPEDGGSGGFLAYREVWLNDILLLEPEEQVGRAMRASTSVDFGNFIKANVGFRNVGAGFEEIGTTSVARTTTTSENADATVELSKFMPDLWNVRMPLTGAVTRSETVTEEKYDPKQSIYSQGKTIGVSRRAGIAFGKYKLPSLDFDFRNSDSVNYKYARVSEADTYSGGADYDIYPRRPYLPVNVRSDFDRQYTQTTYNEKGKESSGTDWVSDDSRSSVKFEPIDDLEITPSYSYGYTWDRITNVEEAFDETYGMRVNYFHVKGLRPGTSYTSGYREDIRLAAEEGGGGESPGEDRGPNLQEGQSLDLNLSSSFNVNVPVDVGKLSDERARGINKWSITPSYDLVRSSSYTEMGARAPYRYRTGLDSVLPGFSGPEHFVSSRRRYSITVNNRLNPLEFLSYRTGTQWENWDFIQADVDYSYTNEISNTFGTPSRIISTTFPDLTFQLYGTENFPLVADYLERSTVVASYYRKKTYAQFRDVEIQQKPGLSWRASWSRNFRTRADYFYTHNKSQDIDDADQPTGPVRIVTQENPSLTLYYSVANPKGFKLPLLGTLRWRNELDLTAGVSYIKTRGIEADTYDTNEWRYEVTGGYYLTTSLRADVTGSMTRYRNLSTVTDDYTTVGVRGDFEINF